MTPPANRKSLRDTFIPIDLFPRGPIARLLPLLVVAALLGGCKGDGEKADETSSAEALRDEAKGVFGAPEAAATPPAPTWSTNAAPPPKAGEIHEIGSVLDGLPFGTLGTPAAKSAPSAPPPSTGKVDASAAQWTIALAVFRGENNQQEASNALKQVRREGRLPEAFLQQRGPSTLIAYGRYTDPADAAAQADLRRIQGIQIDGAVAYPTAYLCPPYQTKAMSQLGEYDLRRAKQTYGASALYTLQVGWYGREELAKASEADLKESRKAAEEAATRLRAEGELAFFYHGPNRSMVTVGIFDASDFDPMNKPGFESPRLREARRRHPINLYNGAGYSFKTRAMRESKLLSSGLVGLPTK